MKKIDMCTVLNIPRMDYLSTPESYSILLQSLRRNPDVEIIKQTPAINMVFSFQLGGEKYFFKYESRGNQYNELFAEEIAQALDIPCVHYELAKLEDIEGVASLNFKKEGCKYILGSELLGDCYSEEIAEEIKKTYDFILDDEDKTEMIKQRLTNYNTLKTIWNTLEKRYKDRDDMQIVVALLMKRLTDIFIFDVITNQPDRTSLNWGIVEKSDGSVDICPLFDNNRIFFTAPIFTNLMLSVDKEEGPFQNRILEENLLGFLMESDSSFQRRFKDSLFVLEPDYVEEIIKRLERRTEEPLPESIKNYYHQACSIQLDFLKEILMDYEQLAKPNKL